MLPGSKNSFKIKQPLQDTGVSGAARRKPGAAVEVGVSDRILSRASEAGGAEHYKDRLTVTTCT